MARRRIATQRIVTVCHYYPPHVGGIEIVAFNEAKRLAALGNDVTVVTSRTRGDPPSGMYDGVYVVRVSALNILEARGIPYPVFAPTLLWHLWRAVRQADVVHIHDVFYMSSLSAALTAYILRRPTVITQHVALVPHPNRLVTILERTVYKTGGLWTLRRSRQVIIINSMVRQFLTRLGVPADKLVEINNGVDTKLFRPPSAREKQVARQAFGLPGKAFITLFIGRFVPKKGFDLVRRAADSRHVTVYAGGETTRQPQAHERFLGKLTQPELARLYQAADLFVLPSTGEGFPLTAQEAMASGLPAILRYDKGYDRYKLTAQEVVFLQDAKAATLKRLVARLEHDTTHRQAMARQARAYALTNFSWQRHVESLRELYAVAAGEQQEQKGAA